MRNHSESGGVAQAGFALERIVVTQRVDGCYRVSARTSDSGGFLTEVSQMKDIERWDKVSVRFGKGTRSRQGP